MAQQAVDAGIGDMIEIPAGGGEPDHGAVLKGAYDNDMARVDGVREGLADGAAAGAGATEEEVEGAMRDVAEAAAGAESTATQERAERAQTLAESFVKDGSIVLPTGQDELASLYDPHTWAYAFICLFPHGDCAPYVRRDVDMSCRETFAYLMEREEMD